MLLPLTQNNLQAQFPVHPVILGGAGALATATPISVVNVLRGVHQCMLGVVNIIRGQHAVLLDIVASVRGVHRCANDALSRYELFKGEDAQPDFTAAAWETFTSLPHTSSGTIALPGAGSTKTLYLTTRLRNEYGLLSQNAIADSTITIDENGDAVATPPSDPTEISIDPTSGGEVRVRAEYHYLADPSEARADTFLVYLTTDGGDPVPGVDSPTEVAMLFADGVAKLDWTSSVAPGDAATAKTIVQTRRSGTPDVDSSDETIHSTTTDTDGPATPSPAGVYFAAAGVTTGEQHQ